MDISCTRRNRINLLTLATPPHGLVHARPRCRGIRRNRMHGCRSSAATTTRYALSQTACVIEGSLVRGGDAQGCLSRTGCNLQHIQRDLPLVADAIAISHPHIDPTPHIDPVPTPCTVWSPWPKFCIASHVARATLGASVSSTFH
eukprot:m.259510 g.259510  ORF g.259510 m.259510 type:complete len:145 (+) comp19666_c0_seq3:952-1386(+)